MSVLERRVRRRECLSLLTAAALTATLGCQTPECWRLPDFSPSAVPAPPGSYVCRWVAGHRERAEEIDFVIHQHEWFQDGDQLGPRGRQHLNVLIGRLPQSAHLVIIEPIDVRIAVSESLEAAIERGRALDRRRREVVVQAFAEAGLADAQERVVIDYPHDEGLMGEEAPRLHRQLLRSGTGRGGGIGGGGFGGGMGGGFGNTGFGGAGSGGIF